MKMVSILIVLALGISIFLYIQNMPKKSEEKSIMKTYLIDGSNVTEKEFLNLKSKLTIEETFDEGNLSVPVNANSDNMTMEYGTIQIHKAHSEDGTLYEYNLTSVGNSNTFNIQKKIDGTKNIQLGELFYLKPGYANQIFYQNISFTFSTTTLPIHRDSVTGIEWFPYDIYEVNVVFHGTMSTVAPDGSKINPKSEIKFAFDNIGESQKFNTDTMTYELHFINYVDGIASFKLNTSFIEKHYERQKSSFILQITGGHFTSDIMINNKFVNSVNWTDGPHSASFLINKYLSYEMSDVPKGKIVTPDMQGHNTIRIGPITTSSKDAKLHVKIIDKLNPQSIYFDKDINFNTLGNNTAEVDFQLEQDMELAPQQEVLI